MLTLHDLAVLRAAVTYFDEEMGPHGIKAMRPYFVEPLPAEWSPRELTRLRKLLTNCQLRYIACQPRSDAVVEAKLSKSVSELQEHVTSPNFRWGTVLIERPRRSPRL
ncbi:MAG: hypothetical protein U0929_17490 [Planctomycetaceae bacterium]